MSRERCERALGTTDRLASAGTARRSSLQRSAFCRLRPMAAAMMWSITSVGHAGGSSLLIQAQNAPETRAIHISVLSGNIGCNKCKASFDEWNPFVGQDKSRKDVKKS